MFKFRQQHLDAFEVHVVALFTVRALAHVKAVWPAETAELGDEATEKIVRSALQRATLFGFSSEYDVIRFVDLAFLLGTDFDTNHGVVWTRPILADRSLAPTAKMDKLYQRMETEFALIEKRAVRRP
jgi:hypothetical protein